MYTFIIFAGLLLVVAGFMGRKEEKKRERFEDYMLDYVEEDMRWKKRYKNKTKRGPRNK